MASRPDFTENSDEPLSSDELGRDRAAAGSADPDAGDEDPLEDEDLLDDEEDVVVESLTRLPPG